MIIHKFFILFCTLALPITILHSTPKPLRYTVGIMKPNRTRKGDVEDRIKTLLKNLEDKGLRVKKYIDVIMTQPVIISLYGIQTLPPFVRDIIRPFNERRVLVLLLEADHAIAARRRLLDRIHPFEIIHSSASEEDALREIAFFFPEDYLMLKLG